MQQIHVFLNQPMFGGFGPFIALFVLLAISVSLPLRWYDRNKAAIGEDRAAKISAWMGSFGWLIVVVIALMYAGS